MKILLVNAIDLLFTYFVPMCPLTLRFIRNHCQISVPVLSDLIKF